MPNESFKLPGFNVSVQDAKDWDDKHVPIAEEVDVDGEIDRRAAKLAARKEREKNDKKHALKLRQTRKIQGSKKRGFGRRVPQKT